MCIHVSVNTHYYDKVIVQFNSIYSHHFLKRILVGVTSASENKFLSTGQIPVALRPFIPLFKVAVLLYSSDIKAQTSN